MRYRQLPLIRAPTGMTKRDGPAIRIEPRIIHPNVPLVEDGEHLCRKGFVKLSPAASFVADC